MTLVAAPGSYNLSVLAEGVSTASVLQQVQQLPRATVAMF